MASNLKYAGTLKNDRLTQIINDIGASAVLSTYTGTQPTNPDTALSGNTLLSQHTCSASAFGTVVGQVLTANAIASATAGASGTATFFRITTSDGTAVVDGSIGTSGCDLNLNTTAITSGITVTISGLTITAGD